MAVNNDSKELLNLFSELLDKYGDQTGLDGAPWTKDKLKSVEVGDGNLNTVYKVSLLSHKSHAVIMKHSPPYIKVLGPAYPLSADRLRIEYKALSTFNKHAQGSVPEIYFFDERTSILCMECLSGYNDLRKDIIKGVFHLDIARHLGNFMAAIHGGTHMTKTKQSGKDELNGEFQNPGQISLTEQFVFTRPFTADDKTNVNPKVIQKHLPLVYDNPNIMSAVREMKTLFLEKKECLVHGDLHSGSVMAKGSSAKVIDAEFAYVGPPALDVGMLIASYIMAYYCHMSMRENHDIHRQFAQTMIEACRITVNTYFDNLEVYSDDEKTMYQESMMTEIAGIAGCEILRRIIGAGQIEDFTAAGVSPDAMEDAFQSGVRLLETYKRIHSIDKLTVIALMLV